MNKSILTKKQEQTKVYAEQLAAAKSIVVFEYHGLSTVETTALRNKLHSEGAKMVVLKNNILNRALAGSPLSNVEPFAGPNATIISNGNELIAFKLVSEVIKIHPNIKFKIGLVEGSVIESNKLSAIADIPGREGLYSMLLSCLQGPIRNLLYGIKAVSETK